MKHSVFAMELCLRIVPGDSLRGELASVVLGHPASSRPKEKWAMYKRAADLLRAKLELADRGCWDFFDDDAKAREDYDMWSKGMITEEGARKEPSGPPAPDEPRFMTFTMAFLIQNGAPSERALAKLCEIPEANLWERETFSKLLHRLGTLSFSSVKSDVAYVIPGDESWGLTLEDLSDPKFHYFRKIV